MTGKRLGKLRERYSVPHNIEMLVPEPNERACYPRPGCVAVSEYLFKQIVVRDKFKKREYPAPDMASILKATSTAKARPLKPGSSGAKEVRGRRPEKPKEPRGKEKVPKETKKRKLVHISSSAGKFGTSVSLRAEQTEESKLLAAASKAIKLEMVREVEAEEAREEAARRAAEAAEEEAAKEKPVREKGKSPNFLAGREEELAPSLVKALPEEIRSATESFYKFWTERWQLHASSCDVTDLTRALVSQSAQTFGLALECREALSEFQTRTHASEGKAASLAEEVKAAKAEAEEAKSQKVEEAAKLESALAQIEALKKEVYESQCEVTAEALEKANLSLAGARDAYQFLEGQAKWYMNDSSVAREEARTAREEAVKEYIANFHTTEEYKSFSSYWRNFAYAEVLERAEELYPNLDLAQLRSEFVDEVPQTPAEEVQGDEEVDAEAPRAEAEKTTTDAQVAEAPSTEAPPSSSQA
ncbi:axoneme-associated protein mst101(2)-like [Olea europaea var. sylvestris]|uniref:axoneme-associated protein mst101(2)-like n=1 Tax=Olea europaea var. sylvestris TaxID=158386 RepID=UPI000C1D6E1E|nr:axoneme-associated protein mst101(2)-like [Olea europaea var. sylvestris]